jgi:hypothetical protein
MLFFKNCLQIKENRSFNSAEFQWDFNALATPGYCFERGVFLECLTI